MKQFKTFLNEITPKREGLTEAAISVQSMDRVETLVASYLSKNLSTKLARMPGIEQYTNNRDSGFGIRFFLSKPVSGYDSIRFNWMQRNIDTASVASVDLFSKGKHVYNLAFEFNTSMAKILPYLVDFMTSSSKPRTGYSKFLNEQTLVEATESIYVQLARHLESNDELPVSRFKMYKLWKKLFPREKATAAYKIYDSMEEIAPSEFVSTGKRSKLNFTPEVARKYEDRLDAEVFMTVKVNKGSSGEETYTSSPEVEELESKGLPRIAFEQQLEDMEEAVRMLWMGVTNAVFIGGRGGIGKTHNVEKALSDLGLSDGEGYFKNAGSISASGLYRLLYRHRKDLILFDDSDSVFGDQEARNILKGATDTKPKRKIAWSKKSSDIIHPDEFSDDDEEEGKVPSFFDFEGKVIFISNLKMDKLDPDGALRTRGLMLEIDPTDEEVYSLMRKIAPNIPLPDGLTLTEDEMNEVIDVLEKSPKKPNIRMLVRGLQIRSATRQGFDWQSFIVNYA